MPVAIVIPPTKDATLRELTPTQNMGAFATVRIGRGAAGVIGALRGIFHFSLEQVPDGQRIIEASLALNISVNTGLNRPCHVYLLLVTGWVELEVTWERASTAEDWPDGGSFTLTDGVAFLLSGGVVDEWLVISGLATLAQYAYRNVNKQLHILLKRDDDAGPDEAEAWYKSRESVIEASRPTLTVVYEEEPVIPPDPDPDPTAGTFRVLVMTDRRDDLPMPKFRYETGRMTVLDGIRKHFYGVKTFFADPAAPGGLLRGIRSGFRTHPRNVEEYKALDPAGAVDATQKVSEEGSDITLFWADDPAVDSRWSQDIRITGYEPDVEVVGQR